MEQTKIYDKKKALIFTAFVIIAEEILRYASNAFSFLFMQDMSVENVNRYNMISRCISIGILLFSIIITFVAGHIFTKDKRKTVIFAGAIFFGKNLSGLAFSLFSDVLKSLATVGVMGPTAMSTTITALDIVFIPVIIALAYFAFTAFEGVNSKLEGSLDSSELLLSRARTRYIVAYIISAVVVGVITSAPPFIYAIADLGYMGKYMTVASAVVAWVGSALNFVITYSAGYRPYRRHIDALAFVAVSATSGKISSLITSVLLIPQALLMGSENQTMDTKTMMLIAGSSTAVSIIATVVAIVLSMSLLRFYFAPVKISLFEDAADFSDGYLNSEAFTPTNYTDTSYESIRITDVEEEHTEE